MKDFQRAMVLLWEMAAQIKSETLTAIFDSAVEEKEKIKDDFNNPMKSENLIEPNLWEEFRKSGVTDLETSLRKEYINSYMLKKEVPLQKISAKDIIK